MTKKMWGGRFKKPTNNKVELFTSSIDQDKKLYEHDINGSIAHVQMLSKQGIISKTESNKIINGLEKIKANIESNRFILKDSLEDIHMNIESALIKNIGDVGKKVHTARSRNDQVATDLKLYTKSSLDELKLLIISLIKALIKKSEQNIDVIIPFYTHLQKAQPISASHYLNAYVEMFLRDLERINNSIKLVDSNPLGSCAGAGTSFDIDRIYTSKKLGFKNITRNSLDSVSDRDFIGDSIYTCSVIMTHLSRFSEDLIIWNTYEFGFIDIGDEYTTGSSIMPQKKNPDILELIRGKTSSLYGNLINILGNLKGLPTSYNRDLQEDKHPLFSSFETTINCISIFIDLIKSIKFNKKEINKNIHSGFMTATDLADYLAKKNIPFRDAHHITGQIVAHCEKKNLKLFELELKEFRSFSNKIDADIYKVIDNKASMDSKKSYGGTATKNIKKMISLYKKIIKTSSS